MSTALGTMTVEEFLAFPDNDGLDRELHRGVLVERPPQYRGRRDAEAFSLICHRLVEWERGQGEAVEVFAGDAGVILARDPDTMVGIDFAVMSREVLNRQPPGSDDLHGIPMLCAEVIAPHDTPEHWSAKTDLYREFDVPLLWIVDPYARTIRVHRPGASPVMFDDQQTLSCPAELPGLEVAVREFFEP